MEKPCYKWNHLSSQENLSLIDFNMDSNTRTQMVTFPFHF